MIKHIILWQLKDELSDERNTVKAGIKASLEALAGRIPGLKEIHVQTECLESSNADVMLDALLGSPEALKVYPPIRNIRLLQTDGYVRIPGCVSAWTMKYRRYSGRNC